MTPRAAFIEATRKVVEEIRFIPSAFSVVKEEIAIAVLAQVEAFADAVCTEGKKYFHEPHEHPGCGCHFDPARADGHASCRAALRKECNL